MSVMPSIATILAPVLGRVAVERRPLLIAIAERMAAERYRGWAAQTADPARAAALRACADREDEIATRVEALFADAAAIARELVASHPELDEVNRTLFAGRPLDEQFAIQAEGERLGAATWRSFAKAAEGRARETFLACAELEERSAEVLEALIARASG